jgi:hypothetical protein
MHRCRTPDAARLYSSPSTRVNDLAVLAMHLAWDQSEGSSPRSIQVMYLSRQSSARRTGSVSKASASSAPYPSSREHKRVVRGVLVHRLRACWIRGSEDHVWFEDRWMVASLCEE